MKPQLYTLSLFAALLCLPTSGKDSKAEATIQSGQGHRFACTDYTKGKVFIVSPNGEVEWEYQTKHCNDLWVLPNGNLLFNTGHGVKEVNRQKELIFHYQSESEIYGCQRLANGDTFIAECNTGRLIEVTPGGTLSKEIRLLPEGKDGGHAYIRNARKLNNGNYLVAHYGDQLVIEYSPKGDVLRKIDAPGGPHSICRLPNGNTLIACGDLISGGAQVIEVDRKGHIRWSLTNRDLPGIKLEFMTGFHRLQNGNTVMSNWLGHGHFGTAPHIIEVSPEKKLVWSFADHNTMRTVSNVFIIGEEGEAHH